MQVGVEQSCLDEKVPVLAGFISWQCSDGPLRHLNFGCGPLPHPPNNPGACQTLRHSALLHSGFDDGRVAAMRRIPVLAVQSSLSECVARAKSTSEGGLISTRQWLEVAVVAIEAVLPTTNWEAAFAAVGAVAEQSSMGFRLCNVLGWGQIPTVPEGWPSLEAAKLIFPRNMKVNIHAYIGRDSWRSTELVRRRPLPATFIGTMECPLTID